MEYGEGKYDSEGCAKAKVQLASGQPLPVVRPGAIVHEEVWHVPNLLPPVGAPRLAARRHEIELVGVTISLVRMAASGRS